MWEQVSAGIMRTWEQKSVHSKGGWYMKRSNKIAYIAVLGLLLSTGPCISDAGAEQEARAYYKGGTRLETDDFDLKVNIQLQPYYLYEDTDTGGRASIGRESAEDRSSFDVKRARLGLTGNLLNKEFSYRLWNDFASNEGGGQTVYVWLQWNLAEQAKIRFGQHKVPFGRELRVTSAHLFFVNYALTDTVFRDGFATGAMLHGTLGGIATYYTGLYNGNSTGEGTGRPGIDTKLNWVFALDASTENYGSRGIEGDFREDQGFAATIGGSLLYGQGQETEELNSDFDDTRLNMDAGIRVAGLDIQGEFYWQEVDYDNIASSDGGKPDANGFYLQGGYNFLEKWGAGYRYGYIDLDSDNDPVIDNQQEHSVVLNYYFNGHCLKLQNGLTWIMSEVNAPGGDDLVDFRYELQLAGLF